MPLYDTSEMTRVSENYKKKFIDEYRLWVYIIPFVGALFTYLITFLTKSENLTYTLVTLFMMGAYLIYYKFNQIYSAIIYSIIYLVTVFGLSYVILFFIL